MREFWRRHHKKMIPLFLLGILFLAAMSVIAVLGGAVMKLFGFRYQSVGSIIVFFVIAAIISYPIGLVAQTLPKVLLHLGRLSKNAAVLLYIVLDTIATAFGLSIVDYYMESVSATDLSIIVVSFLLSLLGMEDIEQKPKGME